MEKQYFKDVWLPLSDSFYRMAYSMLGSEADARDAVQDLYIRLWNIRSHLGNVESPMAYGARVIRNICIDRLRARSVHGRDEDAELLAESAVPGAEGMEADRPVVGREMLRQLDRAMAALPENQRKVMEMKFFKDLSYAEIVKFTGLSAVNVRVLVNRARKSVMAAMKEYINEI